MKSKALTEGNVAFVFRDLLRGPHWSANGNTAAITAAGLPVPLAPLHSIEYPSAVKLSSASTQQKAVLLVRHGEAEHNLDPVHGWKLPDPTLTDRGWRQASAAGELLPYETTLAPARPAHCTYHVFGAAIAKQVVVLCRCTYGW